MFEELQDLLNALRVQLFANGIKVVGLVLPKLDLSEGIWVLVTFKCTLGVLLKHIFNLLGPSNYGA